MSVNCGSDPVLALKQLFVDSTMGPRIKAGQCPVRRAVFLKPHGIVKAVFEVLPGLPPPFNTGIFKHPGRYDTWIRFASDTVPGNSDLKTTTGIAIKLFGIPGHKLLGDEENGTTADFLLQNFPVFFVDTAMDMCEFTYAGVILHDYDAYLKAHPVTAKLLDEMEQEVPGVLDIAYWSGLPYALGDAHYVKYKVEPVNPLAPPPPVPANNPNYLHDELKQRLLQEAVQLRFCLQLQTDPVTMPLDKATVNWDEKLSPPVAVAALTLLQQDIDQQGQPEYGENLSYNPWRTIAAHSPAGSINEVRRTIYKASADLRRYKNGVPAIEPVTPRNLKP